MNYQTNLALTVLSFITSVLFLAVAFILLSDAALFHIFYGKLSDCRVKGISDYSALAERYVDEFNRKWLGAGPAPGETLLGTADVQSLAVAALLPLVLFKYPLEGLLAKFFGRLSGL
jgi:hypothetical protein